MDDSFTTFLNRALAQGSRSTVLKPLGWLIALNSTSSIAGFRFGAPEWLAGMFGVFSGLSMLLYLLAYIYFGITDKEALRSERYSIQKLAIQRGFIGDDLTGFRKEVGALTVEAETLEERGEGDE